MDTKVFEIQAQSVKDLKQQIADLRDEIVRLKSTGQDYSQQVGQLQSAQRMLNEVMGASKTEAVALEGSYDAMSKKMKELKKEYQSTTDAMRRAELAPQIRQLNDALKQMDGDIGNYQRNVGNYASALQNVKQVGGDMANGLRAMSGIMGLTASQQDDLNDSMKAFNAVMGIAQSAKGIAGMISSLTQYIGKSKAAKTAQDALNTSMNATGPAMEAGGQAVSKFGQAVNKAIPWLLAIAVAISALVYWWDEVSSAISKFFGWEKKSKEETEALTKANDKLNESFEEQNHQFDNTAKLMRAQGKSQKEILIAKKKMIEAQKAETKATIETVQARIQEIQAHGWLQRLINGENKERKALEEQLKSMQETLKKLDQTTVDIDVDIQVEDLEAGKAGAQKAKERYATIIKAAEEAQKEIDKILESELAPLEKIEKEYDVLGEKVAEYSKAWAEGLNARWKARKITDAEYLKELDLIGKRTLAVQNAVNDERLRKVRDYYKSVFDEAYKNYKEIQRLDSGYWDRIDEIYGGLVGKITGYQWDINHYEEEMSDKRIARVEDDAEKVLSILRENMGDQIEQYEKFEKEIRGNDGLIGIKKVYDLYTEMLNTKPGDKFRFTEPFVTALKELVPLMEQLEKETNIRLNQFVEGTMAEIDEAIGRENYGIIPALFTKLFTNPPVEESEELKGAVTNYMNAVMTEVAEKIADDDKLTWKKKLDLLSILGISGDLLNKTKTDIAKKEIESIADSTMKALQGIANAWSSVIQMKQANLDKDLEAGKISQKQYEEENKRLKKSFENQQKFSIGLAWVNTALAVVKALATSSTWYEGLINSAIALSTGIAQVASIKAQSYNGGGSGVGSIPQLVDRTPQATVGLNYNDLVDQQNANPVKVYVTDSDLAEGLNKRKVRVQDTSF